MKIDVIKEILSGIGNDYTKLTSAQVNILKSAGNKILTKYLLLVTTSDAFTQEDIDDICILLKFSDHAIGLELLTRCLDTNNILLVKGLSSTNFFYENLQKIIPMLVHGLKNEEIRSNLENILIDLAAFHPVIINYFSIVPQLIILKYINTVLDKDDIESHIILSNPIIIKMLEKIIELTPETVARTIEYDTVVFEQRRFSYNAEIENLLN